MSSTAVVADEARVLSEAERAVDAALDAGADDAVASVGEGRSVEYVYRDGRVEKVQESVGKSLGIEIYVDGRYSVHSSNDLRPESLRRFVSDAVTLTRALEPDPYRALPDPSLYEGRFEGPLDLVDEDLGSLGRDRVLARLAEMDAACHADPRVLSAACTIQTSSGLSGRASSNGFAGTRAGTSAAWVSEVTALDEGGRRPEAHAYAQARHLADLEPPESIAAEALSRALARLGSRRGPATPATIVVDREAACGLLARVFGALTAGAIQQKRSFLADRLDERIASPLLSLTDDPLLRRGLASRAYDGEGLAARRREIVEDGILRSYYVDTYYGRKLGWTPTTGDPSNLIVRPGERSRDELLRDAGQGLFVVSWAGGNADPTTGDFSFGMRGHLIENGELGPPVGEMNLTGNYLELLQNLVAVGNDPFPHSALRAPTLVFRRPG